MIDQLEGLEFHVVRIPMRHRFRGVDHRDAVLIEGVAGWGEFSPFSDYPPAVTARWLAAAIELANSPPPRQVRARVPVNVTIPAVHPRVAAELVLESGADTAKVKVGDHPESEGEDLERVSAVRDVLGPDGHVRIDVNGAWDLETATKRLIDFEHYDIQYAEQPVSTMDEMVELRRRVSVPLAADELVRNGPDPLEVVERGAADLVILKVQPMGGVAVVLEITARCGVPVVISSALETSIGMFGGVLAAAALPELPFACGLGTVGLMGGDPTSDPLIPHNGYLEVRRPEPDPELLETWKPGPSVVAAMMERVRSAADVMP